MIKGSPAFDALAIGSINIDFTKNPIHIEVSAGFVNSKTGDTHGWTKASGRVWSVETMEKMRELIDHMERDLAKLHMTEGTLDKARKNLDLGLSEHLGGATEAPSV